MQRSRSFEIGCAAHFQSNDAYSLICLGFIMSTSSDIRALAREGLNTSEIARRLGIRYQHAYNVLKAEGPLVGGEAKNRHGTFSRPLKPELYVSTLIDAGFSLASQWFLSSAGDLSLGRPLPKAIGVYAFAKGATVLYVGLATMGLAKRLYFYGKPGPTQRTSIRLNSLIKDELAASFVIDVYTATPPDLEWNGLPVHGSAGIELGLIKKYALPWNMRGSS